MNVDRRAQLTAGVVKVLVERHFAPHGASFALGAPIGPGVVGTAASDDGLVGWVMLYPGGDATAGAVVGWAASAGVQRLHVLFDPGERGTDQPGRYGPGTWARLLSYVGATMWRARPDSVDAVAPAPMPAVVPAPTGPAAESFIALCREVGIDAVAEEGLWRGEVRGLEIVRQRVDDPAAFDVGIGRFDQEIARVTAAADPYVAVQRVADLVKLHRSVETPLHPMAQLCRERWMRWAWLQAHDNADAVGPVQPRLSLRDPAICGARPGGAIQSLRVFTTGTDPDAILQAADLAVRVGTTDVVVEVPDPTFARLAQRIADTLDNPPNIDIVRPPWA